MRRREVADKTRSIYRSARYASVGLEIGISIVIGMLGGWWIDVKFGFGPWGLMVGLCLGFTAAVRAMLRTYRMIMADHATEESATSKESDDGHPQ